MRVFNRIGLLFRERLPAWGKGAAAMFWPPRCLLCGAFPEEDTFLCRTCWQDFVKATGQDYCRRCGRSVSPYGLLPSGCGSCEQERVLTDGILRVGQYDSCLRSLLLRLKFREMTELADFLGPLLEAVFETRPWGKIDYLVPVPLHWLRRMQRGFNQAYLLVRAMKGVGVPACCDLVRIRYTRRQWNLTESQRRRNVKGAFAVRREHSFEGASVCLVDDIATSRATLNECARVLKRAGAEKVYALVAAVAEPTE